MDETYSVYVKTDDYARITDINSQEYLSDTTGWIRIDEGYGDRFRHAQAHYLPVPLCDERGVYRYRLDGVTVVERTQEKMDADAAAMRAPESMEERIRSLEEDNAMLLECLLEMSELVYA